MAYADSVFKGDATAVVAQAEAEPLVTIESEAEWMHTLQAYLQQGMFKLAALNR